MATLTGTCRRTRHRLAILAGDRDGRDAGLDFHGRRQVERHLIACASCRSERDALETAVSALRLAGSVAPTRPDAPSLWPDLHREIRAARHPRRPLLPFVSLNLNLGLGPAWGLAASFLFLGTVVGLTGGWQLGRYTSRRARPHVEDNAFRPRPALPDGPQPKVVDLTPPPRLEPVVTTDPKALNPRDPMRTQ